MSASVPTKSPWDTWAETFIVYLICNYMFWFLAVGFVLLHLWYIGYGWFSAICVMLYAPQLIDPVQFNYGRPWPWLRDHKIWRYAHSYFPMECVKTAELDPNKQYIYGVNPHGILIVSRMALWGGKWKDVFPKIPFPTLLGASPLFFMPFCREICLAMSGVDAGRKTAKRNLSIGRSLMIFLGGAAEIFETQARRQVCMISTKKGFVRLALEHGTDLVPVYVFGETEVFSQVHAVRKLQRITWKTAMTPTPFFWGRWGTILPYKTPFTVVFGAPIAVEQVETPTQDQIDALHQRYIAALTELYEANRDKYGMAGLPLVIR